MLDDDFFSDAGSSLDLSDAGLEARGWEGDGVESAGEPPEPVADTEPTGTEESDSEPVEPESTEIDAAGDTDTASAGQDEPDLSLPEKLQGKSASDLARMYLELEKLEGNRTGEMGDLRSVVEKQAEQLELLRDHLAQQSQAQTADDLVDMVRQNPQGTYHQAVTALEEGRITIDVVEEVIDEVDAQADELADEGNTEAARQYRKLARAMQRDFDRRVTLAETRQAQATTVAPLQKQAKVQAYQAGIATFFDANSVGEDDAADATAYQVDIQNLVKGKDLGNTAEQVAANLKQALIYVRGMNPTRSAAFVRQQTALKSQVIAEKGSAEPPPATLTEADQIRDKLFNRKDPADLIFADF